jgi:hypothetical protein
MLQLLFSTLDLSDQFGKLTAVAQIELTIGTVQHVASSFAPMDYS